jgi:hypothetical protein
MQRASALLDGQKLIRFSLTPEGLRCAFEFDLGGILRTVPNDKKGEQWLLLTPGHKVLTLRGDRRYRYAPADLPDDKGAWKPVITSR